VTDRLSSAAASGVYSKQRRAIALSLKRTNRLVAFLRCKMSLLTLSDNLQPPITALRKDHSIILSAMDQDKPGRLHELDAQVTIAVLRNLAPRSCDYWALHPLRGCLSD
jgi:hypothetical protein